MVLSVVFGVLASVATAESIVSQRFGIEDKGAAVMEPLRQTTWCFGGEIGGRIDRNERAWLLRAVEANPGMLEMFRQRDRELPYETPVPWAGEFAGKYLISAVQACRMTPNPALRNYVATFVRELVKSQAEDGYLGPWPKDERLLGHWDLWGHYHCMLGLLMWYDESGDMSALDCTLRAADLMCRIYLEGTRRPIDAGTPMINLSVLHVLGNLYRRTGEQRYLDLMYRIVEDMEKDGDWLRLGEQGVPYYKLPGGGTRWESLHIVQGLVELYRITGEERYKTAVLNLWRSIRDYDRHPSGAFSTHEQAYGTIYEPGAIETCCSVAWEALTIDVLLLTGDASVADELELTTWNQVLAAQHPSGSWCTYNTPLNGLRIPSFHDIRFQARPGTPELNCCSVNAPRGLGMLTEWAAMEMDDGLALNFYGPVSLTTKRRNNTRVTVTQETDFPVNGSVDICVECDPEDTFPLFLRVPLWADWVSVDGERMSDARQGTYVRLDRQWGTSNRLKVEFGISPRTIFGQDGRYGEIALYWGPILLAFDTFYNEFSCKGIKPIDVSKLAVNDVDGFHKTDGDRPGYFPAILRKSVFSSDGQRLELCDFASAGAHGTEYAAWLPATNVPPPKVSLITPQDQAKGKGDTMVFAWRPSPPEGCACEIVISRRSDVEGEIVHKAQISANYYVLTDCLPEGVYFWRVNVIDEHGTRHENSPLCQFTIDNTSEERFLTIGSDGMMIAAPLRGDAMPVTGVLDLSRDIAPSEDYSGAPHAAVQFNGSSSGIRYRIPIFPSEDYSFSAWICPEEVGTDRLQQVFSAWCAGMDDPLRVSVVKEGICAGIESGAAYSTSRIPIEAGKWYHVAAVKSGTTLTLYLNGEPVSSVDVPQRLHTSAYLVGLGFNPRFPGGEFYRGKMADARFWMRALTAAEIGSHLQGKCF